MTDLTHTNWHGWRVARWTVAAILLLIPAVAMQVPGSGWNWSVGDFVFAAVLIGGSGLLYEWAARMAPGWAYRAAVAVALLTGFLLIWINLAVGIIGEPGDPHNAVYFGEVLVAGATVFTALLRPAGMARAMLATAGFQLLVTALAAVARWGAGEPPGEIGIVVLNLAFTLLWLASAALFLKASRG